MKVAFYQRFSANKKTGATWAPVGLRVSLTRLISVVMQPNGCQCLSVDKNKVN
ncbi:hypothetical protein THOG11_10348 [Vibrio harveyi]|nr:hypothetical protein TH15OA1_200157 [Vibrio harveyi]CAH1547778.1 hypothetical protein THOD03_10350 [Vibrio harveyi]CAH1549696.1 hypothetical protein THOG11_10348 [Vibrio harveyi]